jgi:hypothetical protein
MSNIRIFKVTAIIIHLTVSLSAQENVVNDDFDKLVSDTLTAKWYKHPYGVSLTIYPDYYFLYESAVFSTRAIFTSERGELSFFSINKFHLIIDGEIFKEYSILDNKLIEKGCKKRDCRDLKIDNFLLGDTTPNWEITKNYITVDTAFILDSLIKIDGITYNYYREYSVNSRYSEWGGVEIQKVFEYGNVDNKNRANGSWRYKIRDNWFPVSGKVKRGYKVGKWIYNCAYHCMITYHWNWIRTKTEIKKEEIMHDY